MKTYLISSIGALVLASGIAYAGLANADVATQRMQLPSQHQAPGVMQMHVPDCADGFVKSNTGPNSYTCTAHRVMCPPAASTKLGDSGGMDGQPQVQTLSGMGATAVDQVSYKCSYFRGPK